MKDYLGRHFAHSGSIVNEAFYFRKCFCMFKLGKAFSIKDASEK